MPNVSAPCIIARGWKVVPSCHAAFAFEYPCRPCDRADVCLRLHPTLAAEPHGHVMVDEQGKFHWFAVPVGSRQALNWLAQFLASMPRSIFADAGVHEAVISQSLPRGLPEEMSAVARTALEAVATDGIIHRYSAVLQ